MSEIITLHPDLQNCIHSYEKMINSLSGLPEEKRILFMRRYWYMDSIEELSERFGYSESKVKTTLFRLRKQLRKYLEREGVFI